MKILDGAVKVSDYQTLTSARARLYPEFWLRERKSEGPVRIIKRFRVAAVGTLLKHRGNLGKNKDD